MGLLVVSLAGGLWVGRVRTPQPQRFARLVPFVAPETIRATTLDGTELSLDLAARRRPLLALVLSTSCGFCRENMGAWAELVGRVQASGETDVVVLSTSAPEDTAELLATHGLKLPVRLLGDLGKALPGVPGVPATLLIQPGTRHVDGIVGVFGRDALRTVEEWIRGLGLTAGRPVESPGIFRTRWLPLPIGQVGARRGWRWLRCASRATFDITDFAPGWEATFVSSRSISSSGDFGNITPRHVGRNLPG